MIRAKLPSRIAGPSPNDLHRRLAVNVSRLVDKRAQAGIQVVPATLTYGCDGLPRLNPLDGTGCDPEPQGQLVLGARLNGTMTLLTKSITPQLAGATASSGRRETVKIPMPVPAIPCDPGKRRFVDLYGNGWDAEGTYLGTGFEHASKSGNEYQTAPVAYWDAHAKPTYIAMPGVPVAPVYDPMDGWVLAAGGWRQIGVVGNGGFTIVPPPSGLDDLTATSSTILADGTEFTVQIETPGSPDTFKWRKGAGTWTFGVAITGSAQALSDGVSVTFGNLTGHLAEEWILRFTAVSGYTGRGGAYYPDTYPAPYGASETQLHHDDYCVGPVDTPFAHYIFGMEAPNGVDEDDPFGLPWRGGYAINVRAPASAAFVRRDTRFSLYVDHGTSNTPTSWANTQYDHWDVWMDRCGNIWVCELTHVAPGSSYFGFADFVYGAVLWQGVIDPATKAITWGPDVTLQAPNWTGIPTAWSSNRPDLIRTIYLP